VRDPGRGGAVVVGFRADQLSIVSDATWTVSRDGGPGATSSRRSAMNVRRGACSRHRGDEAMRRRAMKTRRGRNDRRRSSIARQRFVAAII
jgi:hypothetical protein